MLIPTVPPQCRSRTDRVPTGPQEPNPHKKVVEMQVQDMAAGKEIPVDLPPSL